MSIRVTEPQAIKCEAFRFDALPGYLKIGLENSAIREFGSVPIVQQHVWSKVDWAFFAFRDTTVVGSVNLVVRSGAFDDKKILMAGVNNLITEPTERKKGIGRLLMKTAIEFAFEKLQAQTILLFCADDLLRFYQELGFKKVTCPVWINQPTGPKTWLSNCLVNSKVDIPAHKIDLCGLPW